MALASWSRTQVISQLDSGSHWSVGTITYSLPGSAASMFGGNGEGAGFVALNSAQRSAATLALSLWDDIIAPNFLEVEAGGWTTSNIEIGSSTTGISYAHAYQPTFGSVWFNANYGATTGTNNLVTPTIGQHGFVTFVHEIGHALGLDHMGNYNGSATNPSCFQDSTVFSVMSYFGPDWGTGTRAGQGLVAWADWVGADGRLYAPQTPMLNDVLAMQTMYGIDTTTRAGDTVYGFHSTVTGAQQAILDFSVNANPILTLVDAGGTDTLDLSGYTTNSIIDLAPGAFSSCNSMTSNIAIAYSANIENAVGGAGNDTISGNTLANALSGGAGADILNGLGGNDVLDGGIGADIMNGGLGDDTYFVDNIADRATELVGAGTDTVKTTLATYVLGANLEALEYIGSAATAFTGTGNALANSISGGAGDDALSGLAGNDVLIGQDGNDKLDGGAGVDTMSGGGGNDTYIVDNVGDVVNEAAGAGTDTVKTLLATYTLGANVEALTYTGALAFTGNGNDLANTITGGAGVDKLYGFDGNDTLNGMAGNDTLDGGAGADTMSGGVGNDTYIVDNLSDVVTEAVGAGIDAIKTSLSSYVLGANFETLEFTGSDAFQGTGNTLANTISGGAGADIIDGGLGADTLYGKGGADTFVMKTTLGSGNIDTIKDFNVADDTIQLDHAVFSALSSATGLLAQGAYWAGTAAHDADDRIIFNKSTGALFYDADGTGLIQSVQFATISISGLVGTVSNADFFIV